MGVDDRVDDCTVSEDGYELLNVKTNTITTKSIIYNRTIKQKLNLLQYPSENTTIVLSVYLHSPCLPYNNV